MKMGRKAVFVQTLVRGSSRKKRLLCILGKNLNWAVCS